MNEINFKVLNRFIYVVTFIVLLVFFKYVGLIEVFFDLLKALIPFYLAFGIAWLMLPLGKLISKKTKISESAANIIAIFINVFVLVIIILIFIPFIIGQIRGFVVLFPQIQEGITNSLIELATIFNIDYNLVMEFVNKNFLNLSFSKYFSYFLNSFGVVINVLGSAIGVIFQIIFAYIIAFYFINDIKGFFKKTLKLFSRGKYEKNLEISRDVSGAIYGYTRGLAIVCFFIFLINVIGCTLIGLPNPLLLGLIAGILNVIPYLGPILGGIPIFLVALSVNLPTALLSLIVIFGAQFVESNFLQPKIMAHATDLRPTTIIVGLFFFSSLFGFIGMLISTPCLAAISVILKHSRFDIRL